MEALHSFHHDVVYFDEDGAAELDGEVGVVPYVDSGGAATDV
jgi:hypothetical protein